MSHQGFDAVLLVVKLFVLGLQGIVVAGDAAKDAGIPQELTVLLLCRRLGRAVAAAVLEEADGALGLVAFHDAAAKLGGLVDLAGLLVGEALVDLSCFG